MQIVNDIGTPALMKYLRLCQVPTLDQIQGVTIPKSENLSYVLISYEGKKDPELWFLLEELFCGFICSYETKRDKLVDKPSIPSCFGGMQDEFVLCARKSRATFSRHVS